MRRIQIRYLDRVGALLPALEILKKHGLNIQEFKNVVFDSREACVANIFVSGGTSMNNITEFIRNDILANSKHVLDVNF